MQVNVHVVNKNENLKIIRSIVIFLKRSMHNNAESKFVLQK